jgi:hypothetical protein
MGTIPITTRVTVVVIVIIIAGTIVTSSGACTIVTVRTMIVVTTRTFVNHVRALHFDAMVGKESIMIMIMIGIDNVGLG